MAKWMSDEWLKLFYPEKEFVEVKEKLTSKTFLENVKKFQEIKSVTEIPPIIESFYKEYDSFNKMEKFLTCSLVPEIGFFKDRSDGKELWEEYIKNYKNFLWIRKNEDEEEPAKYGIVPLSIKFGLEITNEQYPLVAAAAKNKEDKSDDESSKSSSESSSDDSSADINKTGNA